MISVEDSIRSIIKLLPDDEGKQSIQWLDMIENCRANILEDPTKPFMKLDFDLRKQFVDAVVARIQSLKPESKDSSEEVKILAAIIRILARETGDELASICNQEVINWGWNFAGYNISGKSTDFTLSAKAEVGKCLVNIFFKMPACLELATKEGKHFQLVDKIKNMDPITEFTPEYAFPALRLLFLFARPQDGNTIYRDFAKYGVISLMCQFIKAWLTIDGCTENTTILLAIKEALQVTFSATLDMGNLAKGEQMNYEEILPNYKEEMKLITDVLCLTSTQHKEQMNELKMSAINCCVNIPTKFTSILLIVGDKELVLKNLFDLLDDEMSIVDETRKNFLPLFMILKNLLAVNVDIRPYAMNRMFPGRDLESEADRNNDGKLCMDVPDPVAETTGNKIVKLMTSFHQAVQFTSNDLLFALVGEEADMFIRLVGFGNAAGLLAMRNLFGMGANLHGDTLSQFKQESKNMAENMTEEEKEKFFKSINAEDEKPQQQGPPLSQLPELIKERDGEDEEEKEDRMVRNFEKLVDAGFIKVVKK